MSNRKTRRSASEVLSSVEATLLQQIATEAEATATEPTATEPTVTEPTVTEPTVTEPTATEPTVPEVSQEEIAQRVREEQEKRDKAMQDSLVELKEGVDEIAKGDASYRIGRLLGFKHFSRYIQLQYLSGMKDRGSILKGIEASILPVSREKVEVERGLIAYWAWKTFSDEDAFPGSDQVAYTTWYDTWGILMTRVNEKTPSECYALIEGVEPDEAKALFAKYHAFKSKEGREETRKAINDLLALAKKRLDAKKATAEQHKAELKEKQLKLEERNDELNKEIEVAKSEGGDITPLIEEREKVTQEWKNTTVKVVQANEEMKEAAESSADVEDKLKKMNPTKKEKTLLGNIDPKLFIDAAPYDLAKVLCHMMTENKDPSLVWSNLIDRLFTTGAGSRLDKAARDSLAAAYWDLEKGKKQSK